MANKIEGSVTPNFKLAQVSTAGLGYAELGKAKSHNHVVTTYVYIEPFGLETANDRTTYIYISMN